MTDEQLLKKLKKDKDVGLSTVIDLYSGLLYKIVCGVILPYGTQQDAEECLSDTFLAFYGGIDNIDITKASIKAYLAVIAKRKAIDRYRKLKTEALYISDADSGTQLYKEDFAPDLDKKAFVAFAVKALGEPDTTIVTRRYYLGETAAQIGEKLGMSEAAVQKRLERCRKKLKEELGGVING